MYRSIALTTLVHDDGSTTDGYHQHAPTLADHLIVEVNSDDGVRPDPSPPHPPVDQSGRGNSFSNACQSSQRHRKATGFWLADREGPAPSNRTSLSLQLSRRAPALSQR